MVGLTGFYFHDLRHTGNTLAAATRASTREFMARMGYASPRAATIYQHATEDRDKKVAAALSKLATDAAKASSDTHGQPPTEEDDVSTHCSMDVRSTPSERSNIIPFRRKSPGQGGEVFTFGADRKRE